MGQVSSDRTFVHKVGSSDANTVEQCGNCKIKQASYHNVWISPSGVSQYGFKLIILENNCCKLYPDVLKAPISLTKTRWNKMSKKVFSIANYQ